jgi:membrane-associated phospholipid phosphatase
MQLLRVAMSLGLENRVGTLTWVVALRWATTARARRPTLSAHDAFGAHRRPARARTVARDATATPGFVLRELALWAAIYPLYLAIRGWSIADPDHAFADAWNVIGFERELGLFRELEAQRLLEPLEGFFSSYYMLGFAPVVASVLVWLARAHRPLYQELRTLLFVSLGLALIVYVTFPTAPPRLVPGLRITDTVGLAGHDSGSFAGVRFDPYAAMPSLHVGWSVLIAVIVYRATRRSWLRAVAVAHPVLMALAVTATGNHYLVDSLAGALVALLALVAVDAWRRARAPRRPSPARAHSRVA